MVAFLTAFCAGSLSAQSYLGTYYTFYRSGISYDKLIDDNVFWEISLGVDYGNSVLRQSRAPGVAATFTYNFIVSDWKHPGGGESRLYAGPGVTVGLLKEENYGLMLGLSGAIGYEYEFNFPIVLGISVLPTLGVHIKDDTDSGGMLMDLYRNGLRWSFCPQVTLKYNLGGATSVKKAIHPKESTYFAEGESPRRFTYGIEWTYSAMIAEIVHHNYTSPTGRVDTKGLSMNYINNGFALAHIGLNCGKHLNLSVFGGIGSIYKYERAFPLTLRGTWFFGQEPSASRWFALLDGGCAFRNGSDTAVLGKTGGGYRVSLSRSVKLDFSLAYQFTYASLTINDEDGNEVPQSRIRRNDNYLNSINFSIGITL